MKKSVLLFGLVCCSALPPVVLADEPAPKQAPAPEPAPALNPYAIGASGEQGTAMVPPTPPAASATAADPSPFAPLSTPEETRRKAETRRVVESWDDGFDWYGTLFANRLSVGVAVSGSSMKKTRVPYDPTQENNFLGNINYLDESDMNGVGVVVRYELCPYLAFQFSNDLHAELGMWNHDHESRDADFVVDGNTYEALLMCPIDSIRCTPYVGLGVTDLSCSIDYNNWWHLGWSSPSDYDVYANGSTAARNSVSRQMIVSEPSSAFTLSVGVTVKLQRHIQLDVFYRKISADDATVDFSKVFGTVSKHMRDGYVPLECSCYGGAVRFVF